MSANEKLRARYRARELQRKKNEERARRDRANAAGAEEIRAILHRLGAVDTWERKRFDHAAENIRADAVKRRSSHFRGLQTVIEQMRGRGQTLAQIAELAGPDGRELQAVLRRARSGDAGRQGPPASSETSGRPDSDPIGLDPRSKDAPAGSPSGGAGGYDPTRCIRCDVAMLDEDAAPRRGRRRLYCSDTCRRDASAARNAAQRYGAPIRVIEVPKAADSQQREAETAEPSQAVAPMDAANKVLDDGEALRELLARVAEQARLKKLDRATLTAARELSNAVHPHRGW
ncbi:hypothetical protein [Mycolicibacterium grossiae]|uniref:hypothetical protein n=1 Tax=Mycolicibacterium grossiae TaxID=1552759 RepID=UPI0009F2008C|nr:hypothetical protein [Mycolicibacterium grossiae]QEM47893.1 hypothetical protein FZ046_26810 [Mycolicibacterium grossiae]